MYILKKLLVTPVEETGQTKISCAMKDTKTENVYVSESYIDANKTVSDVAMALTRLADNLVENLSA